MRMELVESNHKKTSSADHNQGATNNIVIAGGAGEGRRLEGCEARFGYANVRSRRCFDQATEPAFSRSAAIKGGTMTETLHAAEHDAGTAPRASSNVRHLCRMEIPGGGQVT